MLLFAGDNVTDDLTKLVNQFKEASNMMVAVFEKMLSGTGGSGDMNAGFIKSGTGKYI